MSAFVKLLVLVVIVFVSGCASTVKKQSTGQTALLAASVETRKVGLLITGTQESEASDDWQTFRAEWRTAFSSAASKAGLEFAYFESEPPEQSLGTTLVKITVNDYRYLTSGARYGFGIMIGNAFIDSNAEFIELPSRRSLGSLKYSTSSSAWEGVFSAMTDKQVMAISNAVIQEINRKRESIAP